MTVLEAGGMLTRTNMFPTSSYAYNGWGVGNAALGLGLGGREWIGPTIVEVDSVKDSAVRSPAELIAVGDSEKQGGGLSSRVRQRAQVRIVSL